MIGSIGVLKYSDHPSESHSTEKLETFGESDATVQDHPLSTVDRYWTCQETCYRVFSRKICYFMLQNSIGQRTEAKWPRTAKESDGWTMEQQQMYETQIYCTKVR